MLLPVDVDTPAPVPLEVSAHLQERLLDVDPTVVEAVVRLPHLDVTRRAGRPLRRELEDAARDRLSFALRSGWRGPGARAHGG